MNILSRPSSYKNYNFPILSYDHLSLRTRERPPTFSNGTIEGKRIRTRFNFNMPNITHDRYMGTFTELQKYLLDISTY